MEGGACLPCLRKCCGCGFRRPTSSDGEGDSVEWRSTIFPARRPLYRAGQAADKVFVLESGIVELVVHLPSGRNRIVGLHGPGAVLGAGLDDVKGQGYYTHSAVPLRTVSAAWLFSSTLRRHRDAGAGWYLALLERQCAELRRSERWIAEFTVDATRCRIARLIVYLTELDDTRCDGDASEVELLTCEEFGDAVGVSTETASRVLADFKRAGLLRPCSPDHRHRYRLDLPRLQRAAIH